MTMMDNLQMMRGMTTAGGKGRNRQGTAASGNGRRHASDDANDARRSAAHADDAADGESYPGVGNEV